MLAVAPPENSQRGSWWTEWDSERSMVTHQIISPRVNSVSSLAYDCALDLHLLFFIKYINMNPTNLHLV